MQLQEFFNSLFCPPLYRDNIDLLVRNGAILTEKGIEFWNKFNRNELSMQREMISLIQLTPHTITFLIPSVAAHSASTVSISSVQNQKQINFVESFYRGFANGSKHLLSSFHSLSEELDQSLQQYIPLDIITLISEYCVGSKPRKVELIPIHTNSSQLQPV